MVNRHIHYNDVTMGAIASQITSLTIVYWIVYSDADQRKHQSSASLAFVRGIHRGPVNSGDGWIPRTNGQLRGQCFHCITSSWHAPHGDYDLVTKKVQQCVYDQECTVQPLRFSWHDVYVYNIGSKIYLPLPDVRFYKYEGNFAGLKHLVFKYHVSCEFFTE